MLTKFLIKQEIVYKVLRITLHVWYYLYQLHKQLHDYVNTFFPVRIDQISGRLYIVHGAFGTIFFYIIEKRVAYMWNVYKQKFFIFSLSNNKNRNN